MAAGVKFGGYPNKQAQLDAIASGGPDRIDGKTLRTDTFDPNLRDEGAGFFSTLFTAGSNIGTDALTELGYLAQAVARPIDTGEAILRVAAGYAQKALPDSFEQYLPEDWATNKMYANAINDYYAEKYGSLEQAADSFAEQPVSVALDVFAVKALLTAVTKQAVKRSNATTKMAVTAEGTVLEGELAARASAELKVAQELERTVKHEGKLVYDETIGAYVPEASVTKPPKIDAAEVAPIASAIDEAVPTMNNSPIPAEGMLNGEVIAANVVSREQMIALAEAKAAAKKKVSELDDAEYDIYTNEGQAAADVFYKSDVVPVQIAAIDAEIAHLEAIIANTTSEGRTASGSLRVLRDENIKKVALEQDITKSQATDVYNSTLDDVALAEQAALFPLIDEVQKATIIKNGGNSAEIIGIVESNQKTAIAMQEALAARTAAAKMAGDTVRVTADDIAYYEMIKRAESVGDDFEGIGAYFSPEKLAALEVATGRSVLDNGTPNFKDADLPFESVPAATTGINLQGTRAVDGSLKVATQADNTKLLRDEKLMTDAVRNDTVAPALMDDATRVSGDVWKANMVARYANDKSAFGTGKASAVGKSNAATKANQGKLDRDKQRMADDEIMAAATQAELFSTGTAAQYELAQASRIANDLAKVTPDVPAVVGTRMLATSPETKLAKYADVEKKTTPRIAPSIPQTKLKVDVKKVVPAVQRVAAASSQAERGADNSFLPAYDNEQFDIPILGNDVVTNPDLSEPFVPIVPERIDVEQPENTRPGWKLPHQFEGSTTEGNYWSADFEDEHWNTPAGINEAMGVWGRPVGNRMRY